MPYGTVGEICLSGPTVMLGYMDNPKETAQTLQQHEDGLVWLHTGDLGVMDEEGFIYFKQRLKRMIITSGYNVYPSQVENVIDAHPDVLMSTVIGVKDDYKMQRVKAFIVPKPGVEPMTRCVRPFWSTAPSGWPSTPFPRRSNSAPSCPTPWWAKWPTQCWKRRGGEGRQERGGLRLNRSFI